MIHPGKNTLEITIKHIKNKLNKLIIIFLRFFFHEKYMN
jgi:hypothetical protein